MGNGSRSHHLLKHALPEVDVKEHFGSIEPKEITREISRLGQRDLQAKFRAVYGTQTFSNNNMWLRRKLLEAAGLQTPKAIARGRPSTKQARTLTLGDALDGDSSPTVSGSDSFGSHDNNLRTPSPVASVIRRTKRARKPKQFDDMLVLNQGHGQAVSDDEESGHELKIPALPPSFHRRDSMHEYVLLPCNSGTLVDDIMWCPTASDSYSPGHIIGCAPLTPELPLTRLEMPGFASNVCNVAASKILASAEVLGCGPAAADEGNLSLPVWARLPSNDHSASCDLDDTSAQDSRSSGCLGSKPMLFDRIMAPPTPPRLLDSASAASISLLHESPFAATFGLGVVGAPGSQVTMPFTGPDDFDCFAPAPPQAATSDEEAANVFEGRAMQAFDMADSCASEKSVLDLMLDLSSPQELAHDDDLDLPPLSTMWDMEQV